MRDVAHALQNTWFGSPPNMTFTAGNQIMESWLGKGSMGRTFAIPTGTMSDLFAVRVVYNVSNYTERHRLSDISRCCYPIAVISRCLYLFANEKQCAWINWTAIHDDIILRTSRAVCFAKAGIYIELLLGAQPTWQACLALESACRQHSKPKHKQALLVTRWHRLEAGHLESLVWRILKCQFRFYFFEPAQPPHDHQNPTIIMQKTNVQLVAGDGDVRGSGWKVPGCRPLHLVGGKVVAIWPLIFDHGTSKSGASHLSFRWPNLWRRALAAMLNRVGHKQDLQRVVLYLTKSDWV